MNATPHGRVSLFLAVLVMGFVLTLSEGVMAASSAGETPDSETTGSETPESGKPESQATADAVQAILQRDPTQADYVETPRCISVGRIRSSEVIDNQHVAFRIGSDEYYLVQFKHRCPGLRRGKPFQMEPSVNRLCVLDGIRPLYDRGLGDFQPGMRCSIPGFQSVSKEQLVAIKDALKAERRKPRKTDDG